MSASSPTITGTIAVFTLRIFVISISRSLYFEIFSVTFVEVFWSDGTDTSISLQHLLAGSLITTYIRHVRWQLSILIYNNYSPKSRWHPPLATVTEVNNCFSIYWNSDIIELKKRWFLTHLMLPITIFARIDRTAAAVAFFCRQIKLLKAFVCREISSKGVVIHSVKKIIKFSFKLIYEQVNLIK